jgi:hypothetical protein
MSPRAARAVSVYTLLASVAAVLLSPLLALSYFAIPEHSKYLTGSVAAWAVPARDLLEPLVTWASPERVYATFVQAFALILPAMLVGGLAVRAGRSGVRRGELWGWRIALSGYGLAGLGLLVVFPVLFADAGGEGSILNIAYLAMMLPGMLISAIGSTVLGIALLRAAFRPLAAAWLLALALPSMVVVPTVLGHNSLGMAPIVVAWGIASRSLPGSSASSGQSSGDTLAIRPRTVR